LAESRIKAKPAKEPQDARRCHDIRRLPARRRSVQNI
jgi:hypothetical protein